MPQIHSVLITAGTNSTVEWVLDRYFIDPERIAQVRMCIEKLGVEQAIEMIAEIARLNPKKSTEDAQKLARMDVSRFGFDLAQSILPQIDRLQKEEVKQFVSKHLGEVVQYAGTDIWEEVRDHKPSFIQDMLVGFRRFKAKKKPKAKVFFECMGVGYLNDLGKDQAQSTAPQLLLNSGGMGAETINVRLEFNKDHALGRRFVRFVNLMSQYGYVKDIRHIRGFFSADYQAGSRVKCPSGKRNHIALLFDRLLEEKILIVTGGRGHWKVLENTFVDEKNKKLSSSFSKLLSKLKREKEVRLPVFADVESFMKDLGK